MVDPVAALGILSIPLVQLWAQYPTVLHDAGVSWAYSLNEYVPMAIPVFAALGRNGRGPREAMAAVGAAMRWRPRTRQVL